MPSHYIDSDILWSDKAHQGVITPLERIITGGVSLYTLNTCYTLRVIYKSGNIWMIKLKHRGKQIRRSAKTRDEQIARMKEEELKKSLRPSNVAEVTTPPSQPAPSTPTLQAFITNEFLDFTKKSYMIRPATRTYYDNGTKYLEGSSIAKVRLDEINSRDVVQLGAEPSSYAPSTLNCALTTLRRILNLAKEWRVIDAVPRVRLARDERIRDRVLTPEEQTAYLQHCPQPWRDCATIILGTGLRPGEVFALSWGDILLDEDSGFIRIGVGKTPAAWRMLPMHPEVLQVFHRRAVKKKVWVFPSRGRCGHKNGNGVRKQHLKALELSKLKPFPAVHAAPHSLNSPCCCGGSSAHSCRHCRALLDFHDATLRSSEIGGHHPRL